MDASTAHDGPAETPPEDEARLVLPPWRSGASSLLLVALTLLERLAYYGTRSVLILWLIYEVGLTDEEAFDWYAWLGGGLVVAPLLGGALAVLTGPHALLLLGALVTAVAYAAFLVAPMSSLYLPFGLLLVGQGLLKPALYAIAGVQLRGAFGGLRTALFAVLYGAVNVGAALAFATGWRLETTFGSSLMFPLAAGTTLLVALLAAGVWAVDWGREPEPPIDALALRRLAAGLLLLPMGGAFWFMVTAATMLAPRDIPSPLYSLNPVVVTACAALVALVAAGSWLVRFRLPALPPVGLALLLGPPVALLPLLSSFVPSYELGVAVYVLTTVGLALPETVLGAFAMSRLTGDLPSRLSPLLIAGWFASSWLGGYAGEHLTEWAGGPVTIGVSVVLCGLLGVVCLALWKPLDALAWGPEAGARDLDPEAP